MLTVHHGNAVLVIAVCAAAGVAALVARRRGGAGGWVAHLLALAQTLLVAQVGLGLLLLADHKRAAERLHYAYGAFALLSVAAPCLYAPESGPRRLLWFAATTGVAGALAISAFMTGTS